MFSHRSVSHVFSMRCLSIITFSVYSAVLLSFLSLYSGLSSAVDSISGDESLSGTQKLTSKGGNFELGFFPLGSSPKRYYFGIWYNTDVVTSLTSVWVANRAYAFLDLSSLKAKLSDDGNLIISDGQSKNPIWSTNANITSKPTEAVLLDTGNLVLQAKSNSVIFWQSFGQTSNTWLPGAILGLNGLFSQSLRLVSWKDEDDPAPGLFELKPDENLSNQLSIVWNGTKVFWSSGVWDGQHFTNIPEMTGNNFYELNYVSNDQKTYIVYKITDDSTIARFIMDASGQLKQLAWHISTQQWMLFFSKPTSECAVYARCGPFGICTENYDASCSCPRGFIPKSPEDWALGDYSGGCLRNSPLQCSGNASHQVEKDGFYQTEMFRLPSDPLIMKSGSKSECESVCLLICSCNAYSYDSDCSLWSGDLLNLQVQDNEVGQPRTLFMRLAISDMQDHNEGKGKKSMITIVKIAVPIGLILFTVIVCLIWLRKRSDKGSSKSEKDQTSTPQVTVLVSELISRESSLEFSMFHFASIVKATDNFSLAKKIGEGGFGPVYKGHLQEGEEIAVKRLAARSGQGLEEFMNEIMVIAKLQHQNLVKLLGCCVEGEEKILVYEYMPNQSLDFFLFDAVRKQQLDWAKRWIIIDGIAQGLLYLHKYSRVRIIHRDLKASNILLDSDMNPKISDFGMARIFGTNTAHASTNRIVGTYGYMSPEYAMEGLFSVKSDVFSFGVLLLEIISGQRNTTFHKYGKALNLLSHAWALWKEGKLLDILDPCLADKIPTSEASKCILVALLCVQKNASDRPTMSQVVAMLGSENATFISPKKPAFFTAESEEAAAVRTVGFSSVNDITFTALEGR